MWEQRRGAVVEAVHQVDAVLCDAAGRVIELVGADQTSTFRSAAKPFQLEVTYPLLPAALRAKLDDADLALGAASHHGEAIHVERVQSLLSRLERGPQHLLRGAHEPSNHAAMQALYARGEQASVLHNNCSGKHSFMAAAAIAMGAPVNYLPEEHPLQRRIRERLDERTGGGVQTTVIDGCGLPCFVLTLSAMARAWAQLASDIQRNATSELGLIRRCDVQAPPAHERQRRVRRLLICEAKVVAKVGAQGLLCVAFPQQGLGAAIKIDSGVDAARPAATLTLLEQWFPGLVRGDAREQFCMLTNVAGVRVGEIAARFG
ncbi:MAG: asparaginase [Polyangiaceae bacterium]